MSIILLIETYRTLLMKIKLLLSTLFLSATASAVTVPGGTTMCMYTFDLDKVYADKVNGTTLTTNKLLQSKKCLVAPRAIDGELEKTGVTSKILFDINGEIVAVYVATAELFN